jgi:LPXTG-site transpeptidase (sortase) family protein
MPARHPLFGMDMKRKFSTVIIAAITLLAAGAFVSILAQATLISHNEEEISAVPTNTARATPHAAAQTLPWRLSIPAINVDAKVQSVGLGKSGNMAVPTNYTDVGWYRYGPEPGELGSAVIDGHVDNGLGFNAVFKQLGELKAGDDIFIENDNGESMHFVVADVETYDAKEVPREAVFARSDSPRLNLITCAGTWDQSKKSYDSRVVVYAILQS